MAEEPIFSLWETGDGIPPVKIRHGAKPWQSTIKIGKEWFAPRDFQVNFGPRATTITLTLDAHLTFEEVEEPPDYD